MVSTIECVWSLVIVSCVYQREN